jgi:lipoate-protein ligase A
VSAFDLAGELALDEALLLRAEAEGVEALRLWEAPLHAVVLGAGGKLAEDVDETACVRDGVSIHRRSSGGGAVLLGPGCLLFSLVLAWDRAPPLGQVVASYRWILERLAAALQPIAPGIALAGTSDLAWQGRKVSGNSQQRKRRFLLHHGTLLYDFDLQRLPRYLKPPERQPEYRQGREHLDFVTNLPARRGELESVITGAWAVPLMEPKEAATEGLAGRVRELVEEKYGREEWVRRR